ncbi:hypothetical protein TARUN_8448 [Trichoderma arundinaceum]|uniref:Uncharacterized protein n=1 Tax=Trichoderma arundinaceum TaxID=490622 RepID=A0A395NCH0_TRIAR|nr:hypothetical protein TARUN_8448 [Trichoderma arundinaceum]
MAAAFQGPPACPDADMLSFNGRFPWLSVFPLSRRLPLRGLLLAGAATLAALVTATAQISLARSHAPWLLNVTLMTDRWGRGSPASARNLNHLHTEPTIAGMALGFAEVATRKELFTNPITVRHRILARLPRGLQESVERRFATWAMGYHVGRIGAMRRLLILGMASPRAAVSPAIELPLAGRLAAERALEPRIVFYVIRRLHFLSLEARYLLLDTPTVALCVDLQIAVSTESGMAWVWTKVLSAGQKVAAYLITTPSILIVRLSAQLLRGVLSTEAGLRRADKSTWRARSGVTLEATGMRARSPRFRACLSAGVWRKRCAGGSRVDVLSTPAVVRAWLVREFGITPRASP